MTITLPAYAASWSVDRVDSEESAAAFRGWIDTAVSGMLSVDTETYGLEWTERDFVRLVTIGNDHGGWAIDPRLDGRLLHYALERIRKSGCTVAMWNAAFDVHALEGDGFPVPEWHHIVDGRILHHLLEPHRRHGLKPTAGERLGAWATVGEEALKAKAKTLGFGKDWWLVPVDLPEYWHYAVMDTLLTQKLVRILGPEVRDAGLMEAYEREMHVLGVMVRAESRGMRIDEKAAAETRLRYLEEALELKDFLSSKGLDNPNSGVQVSSMFRKMGWEPEDFTDTGLDVMNKFVLAGLGKQWPDLALSIVRYRRLTGWTSSYLDPFAQSGGRVHPGINTLRAKTGRMSITNPALQTLPSKGSGGDVRRCILPEPGDDLWAIDYDGQEARIFAHYSGDPGMAAVYEAGDDLYTHIARMVYNDPSIGKDHPLRGRTKVIFLAWSYGAGVATLSLASGLPEAEVETFLVRLFDAFPTVRDLTGDHAIGGKYPGQPALEAARRGRDGGLAYIHTSGGRRFSMPGDETYKAVNGLCQGSGADVLKAAIVRLDRAGLADHIVVPVHDEVVFSFPKDEGIDMARSAAECMEDREGWAVPLTVETTGPLRHWGEAYEEVSDE